jgi:threonine/homoserine/homoserine lactone efflux protein
VIAYIKLFFAAIFISVVGSIPLGTLNITAFQLAYSIGLQPAVLFALGALTVEMFCVGLTLLPSFQIKEKWLLYALPVMIILLVFLGLETLLTEVQSEKFSQVTIVQMPFLTGMFFSASNPVHIPFWMGFHTVFRERGMLTNHKPLQAVYLLAIALGSGGAFAFYIICASYFADVIFSYQEWITHGIGILYLAFALFLMFRLAKQWRKGRIKVSSS